MLNCIPHHLWFLTGVHNSWQEDACSLNELVLSYWLFLLLALTQTRNEKFWSLRCFHSYATKAVLGAVILNTKRCISPAQRNKPGKLTCRCLPGQWPLAPDTNSWAERTKLESVSSFHYSSGLFCFPCSRKETEGWEGKATQTHQSHLSLLTTCTQSVISPPLLTEVIPNYNGSCLCCKEILSLLRKKKKMPTSSCICL